MTDDQRAPTPAEVAGLVFDSVLPSECADWFRATDDLRIYFMDGRRQMLTVEDPCTGDDEADLCALLCQFLFGRHRRSTLEARERVLRYLADRAKAELAEV